MLDLAGDGLSLTSLDESQVVSRLGNGQLARIGWVGPSDGILAFDRNGDGQINHLSEISFVGDKQGAKTDLEGLQAWDTNADGKLSALDEGWSKLRIWVDRNQNGRSTAGELRTLAEIGITELNLTGRATGYSADLGRDNFVNNTLDFTWSDGSIGTGYDVVLMRRLIAQSGLTREQVIEAWGTRGADGELGRLLNDPLGETLASRGGPSTGPTPRTVIDGVEVTLADDGTTTPAPVAPADVRQTLADILARAEVDFSDHDDLYDDEEARWTNVLTGRRGVPDDYVETDGSVLGSTSTAPTTRGGFGRAFGAPNLTPDVEGADLTGSSDNPVAGQPEAGRQTASGMGEQATARSYASGASSYADLDAAASLLSGEDVGAASFDSAPVTLSDVQGQRSWWKSEGTSDLSFGRMAMTAGDRVDGVPIASGDHASRSVVSDRQKLLQALAGFGRDKGSSPAVWNRGDESASQGLMSASRSLPLAKASAQSLAA